MIKHFAFTMYPVKDMKRARAFYEGELGLKVSTDYLGQWIEYHINDSCFAISSMAGDVTPSATAGGSIGFEVDNLDEMVSRLRQKGTPVKIEPFDTPGCRNAVLVDPEGNAFTLHQKKPGRT